MRCICLVDGVLLEMRITYYNLDCNIACYITIIVFVLLLVCDVVRLFGGMFIRFGELVARFCWVACASLVVLMV